MYKILCTWWWYTHTWTYMIHLDAYKINSSLGLCKYKRWKFGLRSHTHTHTFVNTRVYTYDEGCEEWSTVVVVVAAAAAEAGLFLINIIRFGSLITQSSRRSFMTLVHLFRRHRRTIIIYHYLFRLSKILYSWRFAVYSLKSGPSGLYIYKYIYICIMCIVEFHWSSRFWTRVIIVEWFE